MRIFGLAMAAVVFSIVLEPCVSFGQQTGERVLVATDAAPLRSQSTTTGTVPKGVILTVQDVSGEWLWVAYANGKTTSKGWIARRDVFSLDKALGFIDGLLRSQPSAELYNVRGTIRTERGELDQALADCNESLRLDANRAHFWNNRGNIWRAKGDHDRAIGDFNQALRLDPALQTAWKNRGNVWSDRGSFDKAVIDYTEALRLDPKDADALNNRGSMWMHQGAFDKAVTDWNEAVRVEPNFPGAYNNLAWLLSTCADPRYRDAERAVGLATKACELGAWKNAGDIDTLATAYAAKGDLESAIKWQTRALELAPEQKKASYKNALEQYRSASATRPERKN
jgi:tetratricopeptide (TPR) repeat protein